MEDIKNLDYSNEEFINDEVEIFEPDFEFASYKLSVWYQLW